MSVNDRLKNQHLFWRAGFGPAVEQLPDLGKYNARQFYDALVKSAAKKPDYINVAGNYMQGLMMGIDQLGRLEKKELSVEEKKRMRQQNRDGIRSLNLCWLREMVNSGAQLREKMAFFWHGHFACRNLNVYYQQLLLDILRRHALGDFGTLLKEVSRSAAMLNFLNNQQNRKGHPNENFAREVMELFTLGRGQYTEQDVKEAARAFTGWGATAQGDFVFRRNQHDTGQKTIFGKTGDFDGEDVLDMLLERKETARYLTAKIYRFFVNDSADNERIDWLADRFFQSSYSISGLMNDIFTSEWFYDERNIGTRIKSPVELLAGIRRMLPMELRQEESLLVVQRLLGQVLFYPPNVAGWAGGRGWIDSSTLMLRMRLPQMINASDALTMQPKDDDDQAMGMQQVSVGINGKPNGAAAGIRAAVDWKNYLAVFDTVPRERLINDIAGLLLQTRTAVSGEVIKQYSDATDRGSFIRSSTIQVMSTPEYQLC